MIIAAKMIGTRTKNMVGRLQEAKKAKTNSPRRETPVYA